MGEWGVRLQLEMTHPPPCAGAQTSPRARSPAGHSCDSAIALSGGSPVPHPDLLFKLSSPQQIRALGSSQGNPLSCTQVMSNPPHLEGEVRRRESVSCLCIRVHPSALHSLLCPEPVAGRCHPAVPAGRGYQRVEGGTTQGSFLRNSPPPAYNPSLAYPTPSQVPLPTPPHSGLPASPPSISSLEDLLLPIIPPGPEVTLGSSAYCPHSPPTPSTFVTLAPFISPEPA